jgi:hypothetical protein
MNIITSPFSLSSLQLFLDHVSLWEQNEAILRAEIVVLTEFSSSKKPFVLVTALAYLYIFTPLEKIHHNKRNYKKKINYK